MGVFLAIFVILCQSSDLNKIITCNIINSELNAVKTDSFVLTVVCNLISLQAKYLVNLLCAKMNHISGTIDQNQVFSTGFLVTAMLYNVCDATYTGSRTGTEVFSTILCMCIFVKCHSLFKDGAAVNYYINFI